MTNRWLSLPRLSKPPGRMRLCSWDHLVLPLPYDGGWDGFMLGPAVFPLVLQTLRDLGEAVDLPRIMLGGITTPAAARAALDAGASALMIDAVRWGDLAAGTRIAESLLDAIVP